LSGCRLPRPMDTLPSPVLPHTRSWIFPAIGLAVTAVAMTRVSDHTMYVAAKALADQVSDADLATGCLFPKIESILAVSARIAAAVAEDAYGRGEAALDPKPADLVAHMTASQWHPAAGAEQPLTPLHIDAGTAEDAAVGGAGSDKRRAVLDHVLVAAYPDGSPRFAV